MVGAPNADRITALGLEVEGLRRFHDAAVDREQAVVGGSLAVHQAVGECVARIGVDGRERADRRTDGLVLGHGGAGEGDVGRRLVDIRHRDGVALHERTARTIRRRDDHRIGVRGRGRRRSLEVRRGQKRDRPCRADGEAALVGAPREFVRQRSGEAGNGHRHDGRAVLRHIDTDRLAHDLRLDHLGQAARRLDRGVGTGDLLDDGRGGRDVLLSLLIRQHRGEECRRRQIDRRLCRHDLVRKLLGRRRLVLRLHQNRGDARRRLLGGQRRRVGAVFGEHRQRIVGRQRLPLGHGDAETLEDPGLGDRGIEPACDRLRHERGQGIDDRRARWSPERARERQPRGHVEPADGHERTGRQHACEREVPGLVGRRRRLALVLPAVVVDVHEHRRAAEVAVGHPAGRAHDEVEPPGLEALHAVAGHDEVGIPDHAEGSPQLQPRDRQRQGAGRRAVGDPEPGVRVRGVEGSEYEQVAEFEEPVRIG